MLNASFALSLDSIDCSTFPVHTYILTPVNPMYHYVTQFRTLVLEGAVPDAQSVAYGSLLAVVFLVLGTWCFQKTQDQFILYI